MSPLTAPFHALRYELYRLGTSRGRRNAALLALLATVALTLLAVRRALGPGYPHAGAWVVGGGLPGVFLPAPMAAGAAAWIGACGVGEEFRRGTAVFTFSLLPRRGAVVAGKTAAAALSGALLAALARLVACGAAQVGCRLGGHLLSLPAALLAPTPVEIWVAAACGAAGVLTAFALRSRLLAAVTTLAGAVATTATIPHSVSPAVPRVAATLRPVTALLPVVAVWAVPAAGWLLIALTALVTIRRRRIG